MDLRSSGGEDIRAGTVRKTRRLDPEADARRALRSEGGRPDRPPVARLGISIGRALELAHDSDHAPLRAAASVPVPGAREPGAIARGERAERMAGRRGQPRGRRSRPRHVGGGRRLLRDASGGFRSPEGRRTDGNVLAPTVLRVQRGSREPENEPGDASHPHPHPHPQAARAEMGRCHAVIIADGAATGPSGTRPPDSRARPGDRDPRPAAGRSRTTRGHRHSPKR